MTDLQIEKFPPVTFASNLIRINQLDRLGVDRFVFFQAMLVFSTQKWWPGGGLRKAVHEGLDICFFISGSRQIFRLDETTKIPILYEGRIVHVMDDFLGTTVVARHSLTKNASGESGFFSFYAHIRPEAEIRVGDSLKSGEIVGTIADASPASMNIPAHVHISMAWERMLPPVQHLTWDILNGIDRSVFIDPLPLLFEKYLILEKAPNDAEMKSYITCRQALTLNNEESHVD